MKKITTPIIEILDDRKRVVGTRVEYRLYGILLYRKELYLPLKFGIRNYEYQTSI